MDMRKFRSPESHVAQQSRRDKLRVQQSSNLLHHLEEDFPNTMEQQGSPLHHGINPYLVQVRNVRNANLLYDPSLIPSGIIHFPTNPNVSMAHQELQIPTGMSHPSSSKLNANSSKLSGDPQGYNNSQQSCDWMVSYANASGLGVSRESNIQNPMFVAQVLSNNGGDLKPYSAYHQDVQSSDLSNPGSEISSQDSRRQLYGDLNFVSPYGTVTTASVGNQGQENIARASNSWIDYSGNQPWISRPVMEHCQQWDATTQGLSLSLSSNPKPKISDAAQLNEEYGQESKPFPKPSIISKTSGKSSIPEPGGTSSASLHRHTGPLGPFTGYATILKNSRFLKPAQELLDEFCHSNWTNSKLGKVCDANEGISGEASGSASVDAANTVDMEGGGSKGNNNSVASSSTFYSCNEIGVDHGGVGSSSDEPCRPEYQQKKAKLLYLQEEVCRRYRLYHQQMQMVVSSFDSVAGLSAATPYISLALKAVTRNFRCLKNVISDQIRHVSRALGEDLMSPTTGTSSSKGDINMARLKCVGQKSGGVNMGFLEPQQHGWRPQRGLPERSVAILRAWLFEHFLHPYPTDTDKHMLATQTGLSRNQVSNWFINARVRVWKPMVEEIHMLESKGLTEGGNHQNLRRNDAKSTSEGGGSSLPNNEDQPISRSCINMLSDKQLTCSDIHVSPITGDSQHWNHEKRSRMDFHVPTSMEGSFMGFAPYQQSRLEMGGLGAVSLTLGLRHGVESAQQQQQQYQRPEDQLRRQYGGQMIHDFAG